jgi:phosphoribosylamine--glycine ligase
VTRILLVGGGGREHALAWRLKRDDATLELIAAPGNPGIATLARCVPVAATDIGALVSLASAERVDAVVVGPEGPLAAGLVDRLRAARIAAFGPVAAAAMLETSKRFAKDVMRAAGVPTGAATSHNNAADAKRAANALGTPVVIKASGLAAGKGVVVCETVADAERTIDDFLQSRTLGDAGAEVLVEEFMSGEELSLFAITDGEHAIPLVPAQDHKRLLAGDAGPNTGGMGAYAPVALGTATTVDRAMRDIVTPTLAEMRRRGSPFTGLLYAGLMLTASGPRVVEFNCRFGDPETQAVLPILGGSLLETILAVACGEKLGASPTPSWDGRYAVTTVVAAHGYPGKPRTGDAITLPPAREDVLAFHAGTAINGEGKLVTAGGRVLSLTAVATTFAGAQAASLAAARDVAFAGKHFRDDIGWREAARGRA